MAEASPAAVARLLIEKYGGLAWAKAAEVADAHRQSGNMKSHARWQEIMQAIDAATRSA